MTVAVSRAGDQADLMPEGDAAADSARAAHGLPGVFGVHPEVLAPLRLLGRTADGGSDGNEIMCSACGAHNPGDAEFCARCGAAVGVACRVCGAIDAPSARFCRACGAPRDSTGPVGERRIVTSFFADMVGSTGVAAQLDPEKWAELAELGLAMMSESVGRFGGSVTRLMGDGILALFGAPLAHEDDAERAVRAGLDLVARMSALRRLAQAAGAVTGPVGLQARVGIATGTVVAGTVGSTSKSEYTVFGDAVNLAARLEQLAEPGTVVISSATQRAVAHAVETVKIGPFDIRGKADPVEAHLVVRVRFERDWGRGPTVRSVGRDAELASLASLVAAAAAGQGGVAVVFGEAGLGKSRLLADLAEHTAQRHPGVTWIQLAALSFEEMTALALARHLLEAVGGRNSERLVEYLATVSESRRSLVLEVLAMVEGDVLTGEVTPESIALAFEELVTALVGAERDPTPTVIVFDDLHWADTASIELLTALLRLTDRGPLLVIAAARPERDSPAWGFTEAIRRRYSYRSLEVRLESLGMDQAAEMFQELVPSAQLPATFVRAMAHRSEGNPFFLEEIIRELIQTGALVRDGNEWALQSDDIDIPLPGTLQRLLQARFDRLSIAGRAMLETAAVIGRSFDLRLVEQVLGRVARGDVHELLEVGIIQEQPGRPGEYGFRHALGREAAYEATLQRRRREIHLRVGEAMEAAATDHREDAALLFEHFRAGGDAPRAARYALEAGERAIRLAAFGDARRDFDLGLGVADAIVDRPTVTRLLVGRGRCREVLGDLDGAISDLTEALAMAREQSDDSLEWEVLLALGSVWAARDYRRTGDHFRAALEVARRSEDDRMLATSLNRLGNWYVNSADPRQGIRLHEEALATFEGVASAEGVAASHDLLGMANMVGGDHLSSKLHYEQALARFGDLGDRAGMAGALIGAVAGTPNYEEFAELPTITVGVAERALRQAIEIVTDIGWSAGEAYARFMLSQVLSCAGRLGEGLIEASASLDIATRIGHDQWRVGSLLCLGAAEADVLDLERSRTHLGEARKIAANIDSKNWILQCSPVLALTMVELGELDEADLLLTEAMALPGADRFRPYRSCLLVSALVATRRGEAGDALDILARVQRSGESELAPRVGLVRGTALASVDRERAALVLAGALQSAERWGMLPVVWRIHLASAGLGGPRAPAHRRAARAAIERCAASLDESGRIGMLEQASSRLSLEPDGGG